MISMALSAFFIRMRRLWQNQKKKSEQKKTAAFRAKLNGTEILPPTLPINSDQDFADFPLPFADNPAIVTRVNSVTA